jgi:Ion channel
MIRRLATQRRGEYGLIVVMILATYVLALVANRQRAVTLLVFAQAVTVWQVLRTSHARRGLRMLANAVFVLAALAAVAELFTSGDSTLVALTFLVGSLLYLVAPLSIVRHIGYRREVDRQTMLGALAAYLLLGMAFGFAYRCLGGIQPGPFFGRAGDGTLSQHLFFSFVTLTTTGYGNLVPAGNPGQSIAVLEALLGQLFLVTAVAKIVDAWRPRAWDHP